MKVFISLEIEPTTEVKDLKLAVASWLHAMADAENEAEDPNTGEPLGTFTYEARSIGVHIP